MRHSLLIPRRAVLPTAAFGWNGFDRLFDDLWKGVGSQAGGVSDARRPKIDVRASDQEIVISAELPGFDEQEIDVSLEDGVLTIRAEHAESEEVEEAGDVRHREIYRGSFARSMRLPAEVDADAVKAAYRNGILTVTLPLPPEAQPQTRSVPVTSA